MVDLKIIENHSNLEIERTRFALSLNEILCPVQCVLTSINPKVYYNIFKAINRGKTKKINELERDFKDFPFKLF